MSLGRITPQSEWENTYGSKHNVAETGSVTLEINKRKVKVKRAKIKDIAQGLAEIAYSMGETNDPEEYAEDITEDILEALKKAEENREQKKKKKRG